VLAVPKKRASERERAKIKLDIFYEQVWKLIRIINSKSAEADQSVGERDSFDEGKRWRERASREGRTKVVVFFMGKIENY
jgi:hypothetical protein